MKSKFKNALEFAKMLIWNNAKKYSRPGSDIYMKDECLVKLCEVKRYTLLDKEVGRPRVLTPPACQPRSLSLSLNDRTHPPKLQWGLREPTQLPRFWFIGWGGGGHSTPSMGGRVTGEAPPRARSFR